MPSLTVTAVQFVEELLGEVRAPRRSTPASRPTSRLRRRLEAGVGLDPCHQPRRPRLRRPEHPAGRHQVEGHLLARQPAQERHHHRRHEAALNLRDSRSAPTRRPPPCRRRWPARPHRPARDPAPAPRRAAGRTQPRRAACPAAVRRARSPPARGRPRRAARRGRRPAQKSGPAPRITTTRTAGSRSTASSAACSASTRAPLSALRLSGRLSVSVSTPSRSSAQEHLGHLAPGACERRRAGPQWPRSRRRRCARAAGPEARTPEESAAPPPRPRTASCRDSPGPSVRARSSAGAQRLRRVGVEADGTLSAHGAVSSGEREAREQRDRHAAAAACPFSSSCSSRPNE